MSDKPQSFYRAVTGSGRVVLAFNCNHCHHEYIDCPPQIPHCGGVEKLEKTLASLPEVILARPGLTFLE
jgi:hypothetical protein